MATTARLGLDIVAFNKTNSAFAGANRNLRQFTNGINGAARSVRQLRGLFATAFVALGIREAIESIGRAVDKNLVGGADRMQSRWSTAWDAWGNTADRLITQSAMGLDGLITDAGKLLGLIDQVEQQTVNRAGMGDFIKKAPGSEHFLPGSSKKGGGSKGAADSFSFAKDILGPLNEQIAVLKVQRNALGQSEAAVDALVARQEALNEAIRAGHPLTEREIVLLDERISYMKKLGQEMEAIKQQEADVKAVTDSFKDAFSGFFQQVAQGANAVKALKAELTSLSQRLLQMATDKIFDMLLQFLMQSQQPGGGGLQLPQFATGGTLGAGKWGIAGENGPELIRGPAQITPNFGGGSGMPPIKIINNNGSQVTPRSSGWGDRRELEFIIDNRQASNNVNPYSNASRTLSARGAGPGVKKR